jgi:hypothetical protein
VSFAYADTAPATAAASCKNGAGDVLLSWNFPLNKQVYVTFIDYDGVKLIYQNFPAQSSAEAPQLGAGTYTWSVAPDSGSVLTGSVSVPSCSVSQSAASSHIESAYAFPSCDVQHQGGVYFWWNVSGSQAYVTFTDPNGTRLIYQNFPSFDSQFIPALGAGSYAWSVTPLAGGASPVWGSVAVMDCTAQERALQSVSNSVDAQSFSGQSGDLFCLINGGPWCSSSANELSSTTDSNASESVSATSCAAISVTLQQGDRGDAVRALQQFLIAEHFLAPGNVTGYFGPLTQTAVQQFQAARGIVSLGDPIETGYGAAGPQTRAAIAALCKSVSSATSTVQTVAALNANDPMTWLVKSVCVSTGGAVDTADPYGGCPAGDAIRKMQIGDPLAYHNTDQEGNQQHDSVPVADLAGKTLVFAAFDAQPFDTYNLYGGSDGYDVYAVQNGWATDLMTSDGGGFGQTLYGAGCTVGNGWNFFPSNNFLSGGQVTVPVADSYWEQSGQSWPGTCPVGYSNDSQTAWQLRRGVVFGGAFGNDVKTMDALVSFHGFQPGDAFLQHGAMEVFYFTKEYGVTRWEVWRPVQQNPVKTTRCNLPTTQTYQGVTFVATDCRDWSHVTPVASSKIPLWPLPNLNLLLHAHFDDQGGYGSDSSNQFGLWYRGGDSGEGSIINLSLRNSTAARDTVYSSAGVRYLATNCGGSCTGPAVQEIYQEIPIIKITSGKTYGYGVSARSEKGTGMLQVTVQQLDSDNVVLWQDKVYGLVAEDNAPLLEPNDDPESVYLSSVFISKLVSIPIQSGATKVRFYITPITPQTFDILGAWFGPWS